MTSNGKARPARDPDAFLDLTRKLNGGGAAAPRIDAHEADGMVVMTAEVPGVPESAVAVSLNGEVLTISVDKEDRSEGMRVHFSERSYGRFERAIQLPFAPDPDSVDATLEHGLLTISLPRVDSHRDRTHRIAVSGPRKLSAEDAFIEEWRQAPKAEPPPQIAEPSRADEPTTAAKASKSEWPMTIDVTATPIA